jgi:predicted alpha/beta-hydrolase family hydrolase
VAPVGTSDLAEFFRELNVPTMLVNGQKDTGLGHR